MRTMVRALGAAAMILGVLGVPSVAHAAEKDPAKLMAAHVLGADGRQAVYPIHQGETVPVTFGVGNLGTEPVDGVVLQVQVPEALSLPREFDNCRYYYTVAYCFFDQELAPGETYAVDGFHLSADEDAAVDMWWIDPQFSWQSRAWFDSQSTLGPDLVPGAGATLRLVPRQLTVLDDTYPLGYLKVQLIRPADDLPLVPLTELDTAGQPAAVRLPLPAEGEYLGAAKPVVIGVKNTGAAPISRAVVEIALSSQAARQTRLAPNCVYWLYHADDGGAWCTIDEVLEPGRTYRLSPFTVSATDRQTWPAKLTVTWHHRGWADWAGGIQALAHPVGHGVSGYTSARGTGSENLHLVRTDLPTPQGAPRSVTIALEPDDGSAGPSPGPSSSPSPSASASPVGSGGSTDGGASGSGDGNGIADGGLPITGSPAASVAAVGAGLLFAGVAVVALTRRRRAGFVA
jgi:hypothetical protein